MTDSPTSKEKTYLSLEHGWICFRDEEEHLRYSLKLEQLQERGAQIELPQKLLPPWDSHSPEPPAAPQDMHTLLVTTARDAGFGDTEWAAMFYDKQPYDVTYPTHTMKQFAKLLLERCRPTQPPGDDLRIARNLLIDAQNFIGPTTVWRDEELMLRLIREFIERTRPTKGCGQ
jgi:hypothetical protein